MRPQASSLPGGIRVRRLFAAYRLAEDSQAQAYEMAVKISGRSDSTAQMPNPVESDRVDSEYLFAKGVAA
jgi:hypothetical protein